MKVKQYLKVWLNNRFVSMLPKIKSKNIYFNDNSTLDSKINTCNNYLNSGVGGNATTLAGIYTLKTVASKITDTIKYENNYIYLKIEGIWIPWKMF